MVLALRLDRTTGRITETEATEIKQGTTFPASPVDGQLFIDTDEALGSSETDYPARTPGFYITGSDNTIAQTTTTAAADYLFAMPVILGRSIPVDRIKIYVGTAVAGSSVRLSIYDPDVDGRPGNLRLNAGTVDSATVGHKELVIAQTMPRGLSFLTCHASANVGIAASPTSANRPHFGHKTGTDFGGRATAGVLVPFANGSPATFPVFGTATLDHYDYYFDVLLRMA